MNDLAPSQFDSNGVQFAFDSTTLGVAEECLRKYYYMFKLGYRPAGESVHLRFGAIFASAIEQFFKLTFSGSTHDEALLAVVRSAMIDSVGFPDHPIKTRPNLIRTIIWYLDEFGLPDTPARTIRLANGKPAVELSFSFEIDDGIILCGHLDRVVEFAGATYVTDNKTTTRTISTGFFAAFDQDIQMSNYTLAGQIIFKSPIRGVMIDGAQIAVGFSRFIRGFTDRSRARLDEHLEQTKRTIRAVQHATRENFFPMNRTACNHYRSDDGFMQGCPFRNVCTAEPSLRENYLRSGDFTEHHWNPLERR